MRKPPYILLVEDDEDDQLFFSNAFHDIDPEIRCELARHGEAALQFLKQANPLPDLVFMDLNMPVLNGYEGLKALRADPTYNDIQVIITSTAAIDPETVTTLGAQDFMRKPTSYYELREKLRKLLHY